MLFSRFRLQGCDCCVVFASLFSRCCFNYIVFPFRNCHRVLCLWRTNRGQFVWLVWSCLCLSRVQMHMPVFEKNSQHNILFHNTAALRLASLVLPPSVPNRSACVSFGSIRVHCMLFETNCQHSVCFNERFGCLSFRLEISPK